MCLCHSAEELDASYYIRNSVWLMGWFSKKEDHGIRSHHFMGNRWGNNGTVTDFILGVSKITADGDMKLKDVCSLEEKL